MIYFIEDPGGAIKIGYSGRDVMARMNAIQVHNPRRLALMAMMDGGKDKEREMHGRFVELRIGGEWFRREEPLTSFIASLPPFVPPPKPKKRTATCKMSLQTKYEYFLQARKDCIEILRHLRAQMDQRPSAQNVLPFREATRGRSTR